jgi:hypothetical protein
VGLAVGTVAALGAARAIASLLYGTEPTDPLTYIGMIVLLLGVAVLAGYPAGTEEHHASARCWLCGAIKTRSCSP